jgi:hypothetical protein
VTCAWAPTVLWTFPLGCWNNKLCHGRFMGEQVELCHSLLCSWCLAQSGPQDMVSLTAQISGSSYKILNQRNTRQPLGPHRSKDRLSWDSTDVAARPCAPSSEHVAVSPQGHLLDCRMNGLSKLSQLSTLKAKRSRGPLSTPWLLKLPQPVLGEWLKISIGVVPHEDGLFCSSSSPLPLFLQSYENICTLK